MTDKMPELMTIDNENWPESLHIAITHDPQLNGYRYIVSGGGFLPVREYIRADTRSPTPTPSDAEASNEEKLKRILELGLPKSALKLVENDYDVLIAFAETLQSKALQATKPEPVAGLKEALEAFDYNKGVETSLHGRVILEAAKRLHDMTGG